MMSDLLGIHIESTYCPNIVQKRQKCPYQLLACPDHRLTYKTPTKLLNINKKIKYTTLNWENRRDAPDFPHLQLLAN